MDLVERYAEEIDKFFKDAYVYAHDGERGHVWIAMHGGCDALVVEPPEGGQYELAVRVPLRHEDERTNTGDKYAGYMARDGYMVGRNTGGH
jgi:hypothetical protein